ncbi:MAG: hypothetical protein J0H92_15400 [Sphingobacteriales bacterium]|nr:hypothetical protein [Sphingobacteriales bacterium]OJW32598.1 MAG: hypothetical protein BGO54_19670 [Sphingobacteriales bacterium 46-32]
MKKLLLIALPLLTLQAQAQNNVVDVDKNTKPLDNREFYTNGGFPLSATKYIQVTGGTPYLSENWMKGTIVTPNGNAYNNLRLKVDLIDNSVIYLNPAGEEMVCVAPLSKISLRDTITGKVYLLENTSSVSGYAGDKGWLEVLSGGNLTLYKHLSKSISESKAYGSSVTEQRIRASEKYLVGIGGVVTRVKKIKEIADLVPAAKRQQLLDQIAKEKWSDKKESDYVKTVEYYNSL